MKIDGDTIENIRDLFILGLFYLVFSVTAELIGPGAAATLFLIIMLLVVLLTIFV